LGSASNGYHNVFPNVTELSGIHSSDSQRRVSRSVHKCTSPVRIWLTDHLSLQKLESVLTEVSWLMFMLDSGLEIVVDIEVLDLDLELDRDIEGEESGSGPWSEK